MLWVALVPARAAAQTETIEYYGLDALGSVRVVFTPAGSLVGRMDYGPFGDELYSGLFLPDQRFAALMRDGEAGLDYAQARSYQVRTGRFSRPDPMNGAAQSPQLWNRYAYVRNNPLRRTDPWGLCDTEYCETVTVIGTMPRDAPPDTRRGDGTENELDPPDNEVGDDGGGGGVDDGSGETPTESKTR
jgi:RHS repeat-associated protein